MNIERGPRKARGFVIIDNALAQNNRLSFGARGLAEYLLSLPPGAKVDIRSLAADNPEGRAAIAGYMNELEAELYLVRSRTQGERGRFVTKTTIHEEPQDPASLPASLPKPWSKAKSEARGHLASVPEASTDSEFPQVGPNPVPPDFGQPNFGEPGPGRPDAGETGVNPYKELGERTSSSPVREEQQTVVAEEQQGGGGGDEAPQQEKQNNAAADFVDRLPYRGRIPGPRQREHLVQQVSAALAAGWEEWSLRVQLTEETDSAKSLAAVYRHRLDPKNLPAAPPLPKPRKAADDSMSVPAGSMYVKCLGATCGHRKMLPTADGLCRDCREDVTA